MKHLVKPTCRHGCRFLEITPSLWLCEHASYGEASYLKGAVEEARAVLERAGGYAAVLQRVVEAENKVKEAKQQERERQRKRNADSVRYG